MFGQPTIDDLAVDCFTVPTVSGRAGPSSGSPRDLPALHHRRPAARRLGAAAGQHPRRGHEGNIVILALGVAGITYGGLLDAFVFGIINKRATAVDANITFALAVAGAAPVVSAECPSSGSLTSEAPRRASSSGRRLSLI